MPPSFDRMVVVVRDPRNVVISEHRMRKEVYWEMAADLDIFIHERFEVSASRVDAASVDWWRYECKKLPVCP